MKKLIFILFLFIPIITTAKDNETDTLIKAIQDLCFHPSGKGTYWSIETNADAGARIKLLGSLSGDIKLNKEEWDGVRRVLPQDQILDSNKYRDCVMQLTPTFIQKFRADDSKTRPADSLVKCNQSEWDKAEYYTEIAANKIIDKLGGGQDIYTNINSCRYNSFSKKYKINTEVHWSGVLFKNNKYNIDGELAMNADGSETSFSETFANKKVKDLRFWDTLAKGAYYLGTLDQKNNNTN